ncbi:MAG: putative peptidoglycan lipid flippase [Frankiales bacterium]|nr:putative peptidoglycan lipid flippase [Frankiales bacterium]
MSLPPPPRTPPPPPPTASAAATELEPSLLRSSRTMAAGTIVSRGTGLLRTVVIAGVVGSKAFGDAYNIANTLPNIIYELLLGGVLTSVVVPLLVKAAKQGTDEGVAYAQRLLTLVALVLGVASIIGVLAAPQITALYAGDCTKATDRAHAVTFARYFLPQIAFYGIGATMGAILNTRRSFAPPMWAPVLNNLVVIVTGLLVLILPDDDTGKVPVLSHTQILVLALGTTAGVIVQTVALVPALRRTGFHWRPRFDFANAGLGAAGRLGSWVLVYVLANQLSYFVVVRLAHQTLSTGDRCAAPAPGSGSYTTYVLAFVVFSLPHAIVAVSVITALLPRMSRHVVDGRPRLLPLELSRGLRLSAVVLVPATFALIVLAQPVATTLFRHGAVHQADARVIGWTIAAFALGLLPFSAFQLHLRAFYALGDTRTPAYISIVVNAVNVLADLLLFVSLEGSARLPALAGGYALSYLVGVTLTGAVLSHRLGSMDRQRTVRTLVRLTFASAVGAAVAWALSELGGAVAGHGVSGSVLSLALGVPAGAWVMLWIAVRLRIPEVARLLAALGGRVPGLPAARR